MPGWAVSAAPASAPRPGTTLMAPAGEARLPREIGEGQRRQARLLRRFQDAGVAHGERRAEGAADDLHRVVPRHDMARHADGFAQRVDGEALLEGDGLAHDLVGGAGIELAVAGERGDVRPRLRQRLADIGGLHLGQRLGVLGDQRAEAGQKAAPLGGGELAPVAVQRPLRGGDGGVDILGAAAGDAADLLARRGVHDGQRVAAVAGACQRPAMKTCDGVEPGVMGVPFGIVSGGDVEPRRGGEKGLCIGMLGLSKTVSVSPVSTKRPDCMTMTRSVMARTTVRSWDTKR
jgi:hypothetical protein